ncbi:phage tail assembly protein [Pseudomonas entomophila]|uniref:phage tail assembly protein n=1 Tax=Pseudomonas entomophila TaxID=312306 RepID=UPI0015E2D886|nr:phage tail assembly protein [Pseudomonas entomophila]MBA1195464.1 phage tail assembly protein [Pseudomonas entomophila]
MSKPVPKYLNLSADRVTVTLTKPSEVNGVNVQTITMRSPTVRDVRASTQTGGDDDEQRELNLFASLAEVGVKDLEGLTYKDYNRLATGYNFLVREDEL